MKKALITGITGQDGSYLAEFLLGKKYEIYGIVRSFNSKNMWRIEKIKENISLIECDITNQKKLEQVIQDVQPDEIYNLAAQSFVGISWAEPVQTSESTALGTAKLLEAWRKYAPKARLYQASTTEIFGNNHNPDGSQDEETKIKPSSPYANAKFYAHNLVRIYRDSYGLFCCNGILSSHESPRRSIDFVTRKISDGVAQIKLGLKKDIQLGNLDAKRDWGFAGDYVEAMWLMLQQEKAEDYVIGTGEPHSVKEFLQEAFVCAGIEDWERYVKINPQFLRPNDIPLLKANSEKARKKLAWKPKVGFSALVKMMVEADIHRLKKKKGDAREKK